MSKVYPSKHGFCKRCFQVTNDVNYHLKRCNETNKYIPEQLVYSMNKAYRCYLRHKNEEIYINNLKYIRDSVIVKNINLWLDIFITNKNDRNTTEFITERYYETMNEIKSIIEFLIQPVEVHSDILMKLGTLIAKNNLREEIERLEAVIDSKKKLLEVLDTDT